MNHNDPYNRPNQQQPGPQHQGQHPGQYSGQGGYSHGPGNHLPKSDKSTLAIVLAGLSFFLCGPLFSIPALIISMGERNRIKRGEIAPESTIEVAFWLSIANIVLVFVSFGIGLVLALASA